MILMQMRVPAGLVDDDLALPRAQPHAQAEVGRFHVGHAVPLALHPAQLLEEETALNEPGRTVVRQGLVERADLGARARALEPVAAGAEAIAARIRQRAIQQPVVVMRLARIRRPGGLVERVEARHHHPIGFDGLQQGLVDALRDGAVGIELEQILAPRHGRREIDRGFEALVRTVVDVQARMIG